MNDKVYFRVVLIIFIIASSTSVENTETRNEDTDTKHEDVETKHEAITFAPNILECQVKGLANILISSEEGSAVLEAKGNHITNCHWLLQVNKNKLLDISCHEFNLGVNDFITVSNSGTVHRYDHKRPLHKFTSKKSSPTFFKFSRGRNSNRNNKSNFSKVHFACHVRSIDPESSTNSIIFEKDRNFRKIYEIDYQKVDQNSSSSLVTNMIPNVTKADVKKFQTMKPTLSTIEFDELEPHKSPILYSRSATTLSPIYKSVSTEATLDILSKTVQLSSTSSSFHRKMEDSTDYSKPESLALPTNSITITEVTNLKSDVTVNLVTSSGEVHTTDYIGILSISSSSDLIPTSLGETSTRRKIVSTTTPVILVMTNFDVYPGNDVFFN